MRAGATGSQTKQCRDTQANNALVLDMTKETRGFSTADTGRACSNGRNRKDEYKNGMPKSAGRVCTLKSICNGCR